MAYLSPIQIWDFHHPLTLDHLTITVNRVAPEVPVDVEARVNDTWQKFCAKRPTAKDSPIAYLHSFADNGAQYPHTRYEAGVFTAGFRYNQHFNRADTQMHDTQTANTLGYNPFASWILPVCDGGHFALFGNKRDFGDKKISAFGGFSNERDIHDNHISVPDFIDRIMLNETGEMARAIDAKHFIGLNYFPIVGPKGFDGVYVVEIDETPSKLQDMFRESDQFSRQLFSVRADPANLIAFLNSQEWEPTRSCIAGVLCYIGSRYGGDELQHAMRLLDRPDAVAMLPSRVAGDVRTLLGV